MLTGTSQSAVEHQAEAFASVKVLDGHAGASLLEKTDDLLIGQFRSFNGRHSPKAGFTNF